MHVRNAEDVAFASGQEYLRAVLLNAKWYTPSERGYEKTVAERMAWWEGVKREAKEERRLT